MLVHIGIGDDRRVFEDRHVIVRSRSRRLIGFVERASRMVHVSATVNHPFFRLRDLFLAFVLISGKEHGGSERAEVVRIVQAYKRRGGDYRTLSEADQAALVALLRNNRKSRECEADIIEGSQVQLQDIRITIEKITTEVSVL
jgi:hypothetical protein